jgi:hypothetical protein
MQSLKSVPQKLQEQNTSVITQITKKLSERPGRCSSNKWLAFDGELHVVTDICQYRQEQNLLLLYPFSK